MNHFVFNVFFVSCMLLALVGLVFTGCVFSWKPTVSDSSISVNDNTTTELTNEKEK